MTRSPPKRAPKGTIGGAVFVRLSEVLRHRVERAAAREGLSVAEWMRRAAESRLG